MKTKNYKITLCKSNKKIEDLFNLIKLLEELEISFTMKTLKTEWIIIIHEKTGIRYEYDALFEICSFYIENTLIITITSYRLLK